MSANTTATVQQAARFAAAGFGTASDITEALASTLGWTNDEAAAAIAAAL